MLLGLDMANRVDQSFIKVYFHKIIVEYFNWLVNKIKDKETNMASMRKRFLEPMMEPMNNQRRKS